ncbi:MAG: substrate-binding domain-containing protein [Opitutaceae bacterium]|jgi:LacI family transcriptional regulator|nr:substrate-binding domain-containing protein [Opitutaceae bacterium]
MIAVSPPPGLPSRRRDRRKIELAENLMDLIPRRNSLVSQVVETIQSGIAKNVWREWLPGERALAESLHVSRNTLRAAIAQLERDGVVRAEHPLGTRIVTKRGDPGSDKKHHVVALLMPEPITALRPKIALIVDELRGHLAELGFRLRLFHGEHYLASGASRRLQRLVADNPHDCWVLTLVPDRVKLWFQEQGVPCVVSGTCGPGLKLPFVDLDYHALCRHAAGQMTSLGHRRIVFLTEKSTKAGDVASERGFVEGIESASDRAAEGFVVHHQNTNNSVLKTLDRLFHGGPAHPRPTAMFVANPHFYLLVLTYLHGLGLRVPADISLVCRDDDSFLNYIHPVPTRYSFDEASFARRLFKLIMQTVECSHIVKKDIRIMPDYRKGATLAAPGGGDVLEFNKDEHTLQD